MQPSNQDNQPQMEPTPPAKDKTNKKLLYGVIAGFGLLIVLLIVMAVMLFSKGDEGGNGQSQSTAGTSENTGSEQSDTAKKIVATAPAADDKLEYVIYEPTQTNAGTTMNFGVRNTCDECEEKVYTFSATADFDSSSKSFLLDENAGKKYSTLTDADDNVISTPDCNRSLESGETMDCFVTFSKVPSGSTVSWVFGNVRIDGIKVS